MSDLKNVKYLIITTGTVFCLLGEFVFMDKILSLIGVSVLFFLGLFFVKSAQKSEYFSEENNFYELIHDIKTPATAQMRIAELLAKGSFGSLNEVQKDLIIQINNSAGYMLNIINNISTLCSYEHDNLSFDFETFEINSVIKSCIKELKYIAAEKRCSIIFDYSDSEIFVRANKMQIIRVLLNILTNAVKYSDSDRVITVIAKKHDKKCLFGVNSYGKILEAKDIKNIFKKYSSLNKTGNGLGLYICKLILEKHNSKMLVKSDKLTGNYFGFELPEEQKMPIYNKK